MKESDCTAQELVDIIQYDQNITASILRFANLAYFGLQRKVTSLNHAVSFLGAKSILDILLFSGCLNYFRGEIVQKWGIPDAIARPILCHHQFEKIQLLDKESCQGQEEAMA